MLLARNMLSARILLSVLVCLLLTNVALAKPMAYKDTNAGYSLKLWADQKSDSVIFELRGKRQMADTKVFSMSKPDRIVIDLPVKKFTNWFRNVNFDDSYVKSLRIGAHARKVRFVIDLNGKNIKGGLNSIYEVSERSADSLKIILHPSGEKKAEIINATPTSDSTTIPEPTVILKATATPIVVATHSPIITLSSTNTPQNLTSSVTPVNTVTATATITRQAVASIITPTAIVASPTFTPLPQPTATSTFTLTPSPTFTATPLKAIEIIPTTNNDSGSSVGDKDERVKLMSLGYEVSPQGEPCLKLKFSRVVSYQMVRSAKDLFVLTVNDVVLNEPALSLAHFPPASFTRFVSARAQDEPNGIKIFVYVDEGSFILSIPKGSEIWLKAYGSK